MFNEYARSCEDEFVEYDDRRILRLLVKRNAVVFLTELDGENRVMKRASLPDELVLFNCQRHLGSLYSTIPIQRNNIKPVFNFAAHGKIYLAVRVATQAETRTKKMG